jgi:homoprotocatechuate degradation regulator HpaR
MAMLRAREAVMRHFRPILRDADLTEQQWRVLRALADRGQMEILELARATFLHPPSLSRILPVLESRGLLKRVPVSRDLRRTVVALQPPGETLLRTIWPRAEAVYAEIAALLGQDRLRLLFDLTQDIERTLSRTAPAEGDNAAPPLAVAAKSFTR